MNLSTIDLNKVLNRNASNPIAFAAADNDKTLDAGNISVLVPSQSTRTEHENSSVFMTDVAASKVINASNEVQKPVSELLNLDIKTPQETMPVWLSPKLALSLREACEKYNKSASELLYPLLYSGVKPEDSKTAPVGKTNVTTLIDGGQIFGKALNYIQNAKKSIQVEMFEFQNKDDVGHHPYGGAENVDGSKEQKQLYDAIIKKSQEGVKVQVILDASKWPAEKSKDGKKGNKFYNNLEMVKRLIDAGVDVAIYPRARQGGTKIQHVKILAIDGEKIIIGGENWGNHSPVNHDACVAIETQDQHKGQGSEVDNIINTIFNKDWKFAWNQIGIYGAMNDKEKNSHLKIIKGITPEAKEYMQIIGEIYNNPKYKEKASKGEFYLPEVKPIENPAIKVLVNSPVEYKTQGIYEKDMDTESLRTYLLGKKDKEGKELTKGKLDDPNINYLRAELFVLSHKEIVKKIIKRHKESIKEEEKAKKEGRAVDPNKIFDVKILVSPDLLKQFPYLKKYYEDLRKAGVPVEEFKVNEDLKQRLHCKWAVMGHQVKDNKLDNLELLIGSANWSEAGLENNAEKGTRQDYELTNESTVENINKFFNIKGIGKKLEEAVLNDEKIIQKIQGIFTEKGVKKGSIYKQICENKKILDQEEKRLLEQQIDLNNKSNDESLEKIRVLKKRYFVVTDYIKKKVVKYKRGNHECAIVIPNAEIAQTFIRQFDKDWEFTLNKKDAKPVFCGNIRNIRPENKFGLTARVIDKFA